MKRDLELRRLTKSVRDDMLLVVNYLESGLKNGNIKIDVEGFIGAIQTLNIHWSVYLELRQEHDEIPGSPVDCF